jgi:hypothetical protein
MSTERNQTLAYLDKALVQLTKAHEASGDAIVFAAIDDIMVTISELITFIEEIIEGKSEDESLKSWLQAAQMTGGRL